MKYRYFVIVFFCLVSLGQVSSGQAYLDRFMAYLHWSQQLPTQPGPDFFAFIETDTPLGQKLREKWLYQLVRQKDWAGFSRDYKPSADLNLQCFAQTAYFNTGKQEAAIETSKALWLSGDSLPKACDSLFDFMLKNGHISEDLIRQRLILALEKQNIPLAQYLLKQFKLPRLQDAQLLLNIAQNPQRINQLPAGDLHDHFYLFGLKRMIARNMEQAITQWENPQSKRWLSEAQQQAFLTQLTLYKAMRNHVDEPQWFAKIKPQYYNDALLDWQLRFALKQQQWSYVENLIKQFHDQSNPCWQYWLARSFEAQGDNNKAQSLYHAIAKTRNYYGFLASMRLGQNPQFENEMPEKSSALLKPYQPLLENIKLLYFSKQELQASRLLNDFISELPKEDKSALVYWLASTLQWYDKAVYLSNIKELNNQLMLRFPVIYANAIEDQAKRYDIAPELIYAIIRQESGFRREVISPAGARGLMQIMPYTAGVVAKREKISYADKNQLFSPDKNINIGVAYLNQLAKRYMNHPVLIAAAYNAGPSQVNYWLKNHPPKEMDIWIDTLPWHETRNYLKNIIAFYAVYQFRLGKHNDLKAFMKPL